MLNLLFAIACIKVESVYIPPKITFQNYTQYLENGWSWLFIGKTWCGHTQRVEPVWFDFAEKYPVIQNHSVKYGYAMLDEPYVLAANKTKGIGSIFNNLCGKCIKGYPRFLLFRSGEFIHSYRGSRNESSFLSYLNYAIPEIESQIRGEQSNTTKTPTTTPKIATSIPANENDNPKLHLEVIEARIGDAHEGGHKNRNSKVRFVEIV